MIWLVVLSLLLVTVIILINISCFNFMVECCGIVERGMCICIQLLLVSGLLSAFGFSLLSPREFSGFTPHPLKLFRDLFAKTY